MPITEGDVVTAIARAIGAKESYVRRDLGYLVVSILNAPDPTAIPGLIQTAMPDAEWREAADRIGEMIASVALVDAWIVQAATNAQVRLAFRQIVDEEAAFPAEASRINDKPLPLQVDWMVGEGLDYATIDLAIRQRVEGQDKPASATLPEQAGKPDVHGPTSPVKTAKTVLKRVTYTYEVLVEQDGNSAEDWSLFNIVSATQDGDASGHFTDTKVEFLTREQALVACAEHGTDANFFLGVLGANEAE